MKLKQVFIFSLILIALVYAVAKLAPNRESGSSHTSFSKAPTRRAYSYGKLGGGNPLYQWGNTRNVVASDSSDIGYTLVYTSSSLTSSTVLSYARHSLCTAEEFVKQDSASILYVHHYIADSPNDARQCQSEIRCIAMPYGLAIRVSNDVEDSTISLTLNEGTLDVIRNEAAK